MVFNAESGNYRQNVTKVEVMEYPLIANSGIQFYVCDLTIDLNSKSKQIFHEWFDEEEVQTNLELAFLLKDSEKVVRMAELESCKFLNTDGSLKVKEEEVLANPNIEILHVGDIEDAEGIFSLRLNDERHCKISSLLNQWLPLPYFELDALGNFKNGPYNWVRCKIIPKGNTSKNEIEATLLVAFDTRSIYEEPDEYEECPSFISDSEKEKKFKLTNNALSLLDFCSGKNSWIRNYLLYLVHGVSDIEDIQIRDKEYKYSFLATYLLIIDYITKQNALPTIRLMRDRDVKQMGVEMIIDIGNSRTAAILFEDGDFTKVKPLRIQNFTDPINKDGALNRTQESFDMRVAFQKVSFGENTMSGSTQFTWPSLVRLGAEAEFLTHETVSLAEGDEILSTYSSPKRYLWDYKARQEEWRCVKLSSDGKNEEPIIEGISNYFSDDGSITSDGFGVGLHYSRKSLMTFAFMEILSQAQVQINSFEYRDFHGKISTPRRLDKIILTCPTAMSKNEQFSLHESLKDAIFVLNQFNGNIDSTSIPVDVKVVPELSNKKENHQWIFDEATCSQFVYLYGQFSETYLNNSKEFFDIYGKKRLSEDGQEKDSLVIGSLDIGAGTSDIMVCKYEYNFENSSRLKPIPEFWDSFDFAGDDMMKVLIENVLIQGRNGILENELSKRGKEDVEIKKALYQFFGGDRASLSFRDRTMRRDFNLQVCVPVISYFLDLLSKEEVYREISFDEIFANNMPSDTVLNHFNEHFGFQLKDIRWRYDSKVLSQNIEHTMNDILENVATIMYAQDCDIVILSGRPTSLRPIREIFLKYFDGEPDRLIILNKHRIGRWYPFADEFGYLTNSKSVVPVGAMIGYLASNAGGMNNFSLDLSELGEKLKPTTEYFILKDALVQQNKCFISPDSNDGTLTINSFPAYIGSKQFDLSLYPVRPFYVLEIDESNILDKIIKKHSGSKLTDSEKQYLFKEYKDKLMSNAPLTFTLEREDYDENKEHLTISSIEGNENSDASVNDFALTIQSLNDPDCYWLDSGAFNINIKANR